MSAVLPSTANAPTHPVLKPEVQATIDTAIERLVAEFHPEQIWLFGSYAWGEPTGDSDLDFYVVIGESSENSLARAQRAHRCLGNLEMAKDVIVATAEAAKRFGDLRPSLTYKILREGVKLYER